MAVAFKLQHRINRVFQHFGTGDGALLGDVSHDENWDAAFFGIFQERGGTFADLADGAGRTLHVFDAHGLNRIHDEELRSHILQLGEEFLELRFAEQQDVFLVRAESVGTQFDLLFAFLPADIEHADVLQLENGLEQ